MLPCLKKLYIPSYKTSVTMDISVRFYDLEVNKNS